jgi:hypothetical protein
MKFYFLLTLLISSFAFGQARLEVQEGSTPFPGAVTRMTEETCSEVDITDGLGPVRNQTAGTCYAFTAVDLMNYNNPTRYSALHLATKMEQVLRSSTKSCPNDPEPGPYTTFDYIGGFHGGFTHRTIEVGMNEGLCPESVLPSSEGVLKKDYLRVLAYYQGVIGECELPRDTKSTNFDDLRRALDASTQFSSNTVQAELRRMYPSLTPTTIETLAGQSRSSDELVKKLTLEACTGQTQKNIPPGKSPQNIKNFNNMTRSNCKRTYDDQGRYKMLDTINRNLVAGTPIGVSYITGGLIQPPKAKSHGFHAGIVAGRKWIGGKCQYLVKNSWGPDWKVPAGLKANSSSRHPGYFIASEQELLEHVYGTTTIE